MGHRMGPDRRAGHLGECGNAVAVERQPGGDLQRIDAMGAGRHIQLRHRVRLPQAAPRAAQESGDVIEGMVARRIIVEREGARPFAEIDAHRSWRVRSSVAVSHHSVWLRWMKPAVA